MEAMILAAGRGERLRPATDSIPKPLLSVGSISLIEHHLLKLSGMGFMHIVINVSYLADMIMDYLGNGSKFGLDISYSVEQHGALGTAGGIIQALHQFQQDEILVVNADVYTDFDFASLQVESRANANMVMVPNPQHNPSGDYCMTDAHVHRPTSTAQKTYTFAGIGRYRKSLFENVEPGKCALPEILEKPMRDGEVLGTLHRSLWIDVGNPDRLTQARAFAQDNSA